MLVLGVVNCVETWGYTHITVRPYVRRCKRSRSLGDFPRVEGGEPPLKVGHRRPLHDEYLGKQSLI